MHIRQSTIKSFNRCALQWKYENLDNLPREQSGSLVFGSILHDVVLLMEVNRDLDMAIARFHQLWLNPELLGAEYHVDYYVRATNWRKFSAEGEKILRDWWSIIQWDADLTLAREYTFSVPVKGTWDAALNEPHILDGTLDKLVVRYRAASDEWVLLVSDYKTQRKTPTYGYLEEDLQFSAYSYASEQPEFWANLPGGRGMELYEKYKDFPRYNEWVQLVAPKRMEAGIRTQRHYNRLAMAIDAIADSIAMRIFVPAISGENCRYCEHRKPCGMPELDEDGNL